MKIKNSYEDYKWQLGDVLYNPKSGNYGMVVLIDDRFALINVQTMSAFSDPANLPESNVDYTAGTLPELQKCFSYPFVPVNAELTIT